MFYLRRTPDHVSRLDLLDLTSPFPGSANPGTDEKARLNGFAKTE
jgi:hypothetical protein